MNESSNETNGQNNDREQANPPPELRTPVFDAVVSAIRKGAEHARREAEEALPRLKSAATEAAYWTAYGVSFAAVFQWTVIKNLTPEAVKDGGRAGVKAGRETAEKWVEQMRRRNEPVPPVLLSEPGPGAETI